MADFFIGRPSLLDQLAYGEVGKQDFPVYIAFFQDNIKVTPKLTVNPGVRYEPSIPYRDEGNRVSVFRPGPKSQVFVNAPTVFVRRRPRSAGARDEIGSEQFCAASRLRVGRGEANQHPRRLRDFLRLVADERDHQRVSGRRAVRNADSGTPAGRARLTIRSSAPTRSHCPFLPRRTSHFRRA